MLENAAPVGFGQVIKNRQFCALWLAQLVSSFGGVAMKKYLAVMSAVVLVALTSVRCAHSSDKKEASLSAVAGPELRWKYETGG